FAAKIAEAAGPAVADRRTQMLQHIVKDGPNRSARRYADLKPFGAERLELAGLNVFQIEPVTYRPYRCHPAKHLEWHAHDLLRLRHHQGLEHGRARRPLGPCEAAAEHRRLATEHQRLDNPPVAPAPAVGTRRTALADGQPTLHQRFHLRHAE